MDNVHNYIEDRRKLEEEGWKIFYIFESRFIGENMSVYGTRMKNLEARLLDKENCSKEEMRKFLKFGCPKKKFTNDVHAVKILYLATKKGFCEGDCYKLENEFSNEFKTDNAITFIQTFKEIVSNKSIIPDKSLILLNKDPHHIIEPREEKGKNTKSSKFEKASKKRGQKLLTDFFQSKKNVQIPSTSKKESSPPSDEESGRTIIEKTLQKLRGNEVKIMWIPNSHELDPCQYISVWLMNEISTTHQESPRGSKAVDVVLKTIQEFPNDIWKTAIEYTEKFEDQYFEDIEDDEPSAIQQLQTIKAEPY